MRNKSLLFVAFVAFAAVALPTVASAQIIEIIDPAGDLGSGENRTLTIQYTAPLVDPVITFTTADNFTVANLTLPGTFQSWYTYNTVTPPSPEIVGLPGCYVAQSNPWKTTCRWVRIGNESTTTSFTVTVRSRYGAFKGIDQGNFGRIDSTPFSSQLENNIGTLQASDTHTIPVTQFANFSCISLNNTPIVTASVNHDTGSGPVPGIEITGRQLCLNSGNGTTNPNANVTLSFPSAANQSYYYLSASNNNNFTMTITPDATAGNPTLPGGTVGMTFAEAFGSVNGPLLSNNTSLWGGVSSTTIDVKFFVPCTSLPLTTINQPTGTTQATETRFENDGVTDKTITFNGTTQSWLGSTGISAGGTCGQAIAGSNKVPQRPTVSYDEPLAWNINFTPFTGWTTVTDVVVVDAIPEKLQLFDTDTVTTGFQNATIIAPGAPLTFYYCVLGATAFDRATFLTSWRLNPAFCGEAALPTSATASQVTHLVAYAASWNATDQVRFRIWTELRPGYTAADQGAIIPNAASMTVQSPTGDVTAARTVANQVTIDLLARPRVTIAGPPSQLGNPGNTFQMSVQPYRNPGYSPANDQSQGRWLLNPRIVVDLPPGFSPQNGAATNVIVSTGSCAAPNPNGAPTITWTQSNGLWSLEAHWDPTVGSGWHGPTCWRWVGPSLLRFNVVAALNYPFVNGTPNTFTARIFVDNPVTDLNPDTATTNIEINVARELELDILPDPSACENGVPGPPAYLLDYGNAGGTDEQGVTLWVNLPAGTGFTELSGLPAGTTLAYATDVNSNPANHTWIVGNPPVGDPTVTAIRITIPAIEAYDRDGAIVLQVTNPPGATAGTVIPLVAAIGSTGPAPGLSGVQSTGNFTVGDCPTIVTLTKYFDADLSGSQNNGEPPLAGWSFEVTDDGATTTVGPTDALGQVTFSLSGGPATIVELPPQGGPQTWALTGVTITPLLTLSNEPPFGVSFTPTGGLYDLRFGNACSCSDGDPCTADVCTPGGCSFPPVANVLQVPCPDDLVCTTNEICVDGGCVVEPVVCGPGDICTIDGTGQCIEPDGCVYETVSCDPFQFYIAVTRPDGTFGSIACTLGATIACETGPGGVLVIGPPQCGN